jgi:DNA-binding response OmpR family regulator
MKILIVDDDPAILRMMTRLLTQRGHEVESHQGPFGASAKALRCQPNLILLDVMMPGLNGMALSGVLEKLPLDPRPRVVLWSSRDEADLAGIAHDSGLPTLSKRRPIDEILDELETLVQMVAD